MIYVWFNISFVTIWGNLFKTLGVEKWKRHGCDHHFFTDILYVLLCLMYCILGLSTRLRSPPSPEGGKTAPATAGFGHSKYSRTTLCWSCRHIWFYFPNTQVICDKVGLSYNELTKCWPQTIQGNDLSSRYRVSTVLNEMR